MSDYSPVRAERVQRATFRTALGVVLLLAMIVSPRWLRAQQATGPTPEEIGKRYITTLAAGNFPANASLMHPTALASMRHLLTVVGGKDSSTLRQLAGVGDTAALRTVPDTELYARFLKATFGANAGLADAMKSATTSFIGHVDEPPDLTHVVYRLTMQLGGMRMNKVDVITLKRDGNQWKALLSADLEGTIARLTAPGS
jgi:hypothetical protein